MGKIGIHFNDGISVRVDGPYRVIELKDGFYCVGHGTLEPVDSQEEAQELCNQLRRDFERRLNHEEKKNDSI